MKKPILVAINLLIIAGIAFFAFRSIGGITGFAVRGNESYLASYKAYLNFTDMETGEIFAINFSDSNVFFVKGKINNSDISKMRSIGLSSVYSNGTECAKGVFRQEQYYYDENANKAYDEGEQTIIMGKTDGDGCIIVQLPDKDYSAFMKL